MLTSNSYGQHKNEHVDSVCIIIIIININNY